MKILVTGANGQLGSELKLIAEKYPDYDISFTDVDKLDICDLSKLTNYIESYMPDFFVNCAAYTAVDKAEQEHEKATQINEKAVENIVQVCQVNSVKLIHVSTDYVFDGQKNTPYIETDKVNPNGVYGQTKLDGEKAILENKLPSVIIRTSWLYSVYGNNFVKTMLRLGAEKDKLNVIFDQVGTPTNAADLADAILSIIPKFNAKQPEIYHYSNEGVCSWYDFAHEIMEYSKLNCQVLPIETKDYPTPAKRPAFSVLNKSKIKKNYNIDIPYWKNSLHKCLEILKEKSK